MREGAVYLSTDSPRYSDIDPPTLPPPLDMDEAKGAAGRRFDRTEIDTTLRRGLPTIDVQSPWAAPVPQDSPGGTLFAKSPAFPPRAPKTPANFANTPPGTSRARVLSEVGRSLFGESQKTFRKDKPSSPSYGADV